MGCTSSQPAKPALQRGPSGRSPPKLNLPLLDTKSSKAVSPHNGSSRSNSAHQSTSPRSRFSSPSQHSGHTRGRRITTPSSRSGGPPSARVSPAGSAGRRRSLVETATDALSTLTPRLMQSTTPSGSSPARQFAGFFAAGKLLIAYYWYCSMASHQKPKSLLSALPTVCSMMSLQAPLVLLTASASLLLLPYVVQLGQASNLLQKCQTPLH
jgi:hypothetical protein